MRPFPIGLLAMRWTGIMNLCLHVVDGKPGLQRIASPAPDGVDMEHILDKSLCFGKYHIGMDDMGIVVLRYLLSALVVLVETRQFGEEYCGLQFIDTRVHTFDDMLIFL